MREPESVYFNSDKFLADMRDGNLHQDFTLTSETFQELVTKINAFPELAAEIMDNEILLLLASTGKKEVDGILALAEVCRGDTKGSVNSQQYKIQTQKEGLLDSLRAIE